MPGLSKNQKDREPPGDAKLAGARKPRLNLDCVPFRQSVRA